MFVNRLLRIDGAEKQLGLPVGLKQPTLALGVRVLLAALIASRRQPAASFFEHSFDWGLGLGFLGFLLCHRLASLRVFDLTLGEGTWSAGSICLGLGIGHFPCKRPQCHRR